MSYLRELVTYAQGVKGKLDTTRQEVEQHLTSPGEDVRPHVHRQLAALDELRAALSMAREAAVQVEVAAAEQLSGNQPVRAAEPEQEARRAVEAQGPSPEARTRLPPAVPTPRAAHQPDAVERLQAARAMEAVPEATLTPAPGERLSHVRTSDRADGRDELSKKP